MPKPALKLEIEVTDLQLAALDAVATKLHMTLPDAFKALAFVPIGTDFVAMSEFRDAVRNVAAPVLAGDLPLFSSNGLAGCIRFRADAFAT